MRRTTDKVNFHLLCADRDRNADDKFGNRGASKAANRAGFRFFTNVDEFKEYVRRNVIVLELAAV